MIIELNESNDHLTFKAENEKGIMVEYEVICTFEGGNEKQYIVFTDGSINRDGNTNIIACLYHQDQADTVLSPLETDEDWYIIETVLEQIKRENSLDETTDETMDDDIINIEKLSKISNKTSAQRCKECNSDFSYASSYCPYCGSEASPKIPSEKLLDNNSEDTMRICPQCGNFVRGDYIYCNNCGKKM